MEDNNTKDRIVRDRYGDTEKEYLRQLYMLDMSHIVESLLKSMEIDRIKINFIDKLKLDENIKNSLFREFKENLNKIQPVFYDIYSDMIEINKIYFSNLKLMDEFFATKRFMLYPKETEILAKFLRCHWYINLVSYHGAMKEKEYAENRLKNILSLILDYVPYFLSFFGDFIERAKNIEDVKEIDPERGKLLYWILLGSQALFEKTKRKSKDKFYEKINCKIVDEKIYKNRGFLVLVLDNVIEELWQFSEAFMLDAHAYSTLLKMFNKNSFRELISFLEKKALNTNRLKYPIPKYFQNFDSCNVVCLLNAAKYYFPDLKLSKKLEFEILQRTIFENYPGNLLPLLAKASKEMLGLEVKLYFDYETYIKNLHLAKEYARTIGYDENKIMKVAEFFIKSINEIGYIDKKYWTPDEIKELLNSGSMISFGRELPSGFLHANLIFGYDENGFYVFDPLSGEYYVKKDNISEIMRNRFGMWGFITIPPNYEVLSKMKENIEKCQKILKYHGITII